MYTWLRFVPRTLIDTGSVVAANTELTAWIVSKISVNALTIESRSVALRYRPWLTSAVFSSTVPQSALHWSLQTFTVCVVTWR